MKERIVVDNSQKFPRTNYYVVKNGHYDVGTINYVTPEVILNENKIVATKEQVPENWEELKELCKGIKGISFGKDGLTEETEYICINDSVYFSITGEICFGIEPFAVNRTPQQMWQIIKSLIGEE